MNTFILFRLIEKPALATQLEIRESSKTIFDFLNAEFGGVSQALAYIEQKYGGGYFAINVWSDGQNIMHEKFSIAGIPRCHCPIKVLMAQGCLCGNP